MMAMKLTTHSYPGTDAEEEETRAVLNSRSFAPDIRPDSFRTTPSDATSMKNLGAAAQSDTHQARPVLPSSSPATSHVVGNIPASATSSDTQAETATRELPAGLEKRLTADGRTYFVDHDTRTTTWEDPGLLRYSASPINETNPANSEEAILTEAIEVAAHNDPGTPERSLLPLDGIPFVDNGPPSPPEPEASGQYAANAEPDREVIQEPVPAQTSSLFVSAAEEIAAGQDIPGSQDESVDENEGKDEDDNKGEDGNGEEDEKHVERSRDPKDAEPAEIEDGDAQSTKEGGSIANGSATPDRKLSSKESADAICK